MQQAFDTIAGSYDASFTNSIIGIAQREIVWKYLEKSLSQQKKMNILELNSGTGEDALRFANKGHKVLATDISEKMLEIIQEKIYESDLSSQIQVQHLDINEIEKVNFEEPFNLVFSNFGGMNCIALEQLNKLPDVIKKILRPNGRLIMTIMPKYCLWETLYFLSKLNFKSSFRRYSDNGCTATLNDLELRTFYYSPGQIKRIFEKYFDVIAVKPVGFFVPPSYLKKFFSTRKKAFSFIQRSENLITNQSHFAGFSDHFLIDLHVKS